MAADLSPTARALRALEILQMRPGTTAEQLAEKLGVTPRAVRRYIEILREAGIAVESSRGPYGGYRLGRGTRLPPVLFTQAEALSLVMAVLDGQPAAADDTDVVGSALSKVIQALPDSVGRQAAELRERATAAPDPYSPRPDPAITSALVAASAARRRVRVAYRNEVSEWQTEVDPWAVVVRYGRWYLLCYSHHAGGIRTYRVDRVRSAEETGADFVPPQDLDPVALVEENLGVGWEYSTRVVFDAPPAKVTRFIRPPMGRLEPFGDGCVLLGSTSNPAMYAEEWLARIPLPFRVEGGPELLSAVEAVARRFSHALQPRPSQLLAPAGAIQFEDPTPVAM